MRLSATPRAVSALAEKLQKNQYLLWSLIVHLSELRRLDRVREDHFMALEAPLAQAIADLKGGTHKDRDAHKRKALNRLRKERVTLLMKRERDNS